VLQVLIDLMVVVLAVVDEYVMEEQLVEHDMVGQKKNWMMIL